MTVARAGQIVVAVNPDGTNIGTTGGTSPNVPVTGGGVAVQSTLVPNSSLLNGSAKAAPTAGTVLATLTLAAGYWSVTITASQGGSIAAGDLGNIVLNYNGAQVSPIPCPPSGGIEILEWHINVTTGTPSVTLTALANATAGTTYDGLLCATKLN